MELSKLGRNQKFTHDEIIELFKMVHGDIYNYDLVDYKGMNTPITITCSKHGLFQQRPVNHKSGRGCPKCGVETRAKNKTIRIDVLLNEFNEVHCNKYDYSKIDYISSLTKIEIICPVHGSFNQTPASHKNGIGCPKCGNAYKPQTEEVIKEFIKTHGIIYDYSLVNYIDKKTKVKIICKIHGIFEQEPYVHKTGSICPKCLGRSREAEDWIIEFDKIHNNKYDYSKFIFTHSKTKSLIICKNHGEFDQTPSDHLHGYGCPQCSESKGEKRINSFLRDHNIDFVTQKKFDDCQFKQSLPFDFYIPDLNIVIEYQGNQHYNDIHYFHKTKKQLDDSRKRDSIKQKYCKTQKIKIIIISYIDFDNIETILKKELLT